MKHRLFIPTDAHAAGAPLVVALHGCTQTAADFAAGTRFDSVAERAGAYIVYPEQSVRRNPSRCWNWFYEENQFRDAGEPAEILELVADTLERYPIDRERVFVAGLSAGGAMAAILAEQAPDVFSAVGVMAGVPLHASHDLPTAHAAMHGDASHAHVLPIRPRNPAHASAYARLRATIWTGEHDHTVDPSNASILARQFLNLVGLSDAAPERENGEGAYTFRWRDASGRIRVESWCVSDMGHAWSGGSFRGSHTFPRGPRASDAMMAFFLGDRAEPRVAARIAK